MGRLHRGHSRQQQRRSDDAHEMDMTMLAQGHSKSLMSRAPSFKNAA